MCGPRSLIFRSMANQRTWLPRRSCCSGHREWRTATRASAVTTSLPAGGMASSSTPSSTNTSECAPHCINNTLNWNKSGLLIVLLRPPHTLCFSNIKSLDILGIELTSAIWAAGSQHVVHDFEWVSSSRILKQEQDLGSHSKTKLHLIKLPASTCSVMRLCSQHWRVSVSETVSEVINIIRLFWVLTINTE